MLAAFLPNAVLILRPADQPTLHAIVRVEEILVDGQLGLVGHFPRGQKLRFVYAKPTDGDPSELVFADGEVWRICEC